jgi:hypothetical protein
VSSPFADRTKERRIATTEKVMYPVAWVLSRLIFFSLKAKKVYVTNTPATRMVVA